MAEVQLGNQLWSVMVSKKGEENQDKMSDPSFFLVMCTRLYKSLGRLVGQSVSPLVGPLVSPLVQRLVTHDFFA